MKIKLMIGKGEGPNELAAFDAALFDAGIANYNLIILSSIIPEKAIIELKKNISNIKEHGNKLYVVLSKRIETKPGKEAWACLGWVQNKSGRGLFVEHHGSSEKEVVKAARESLTNMMKYRAEKYGKIKTKTMGIKCNKTPVCSLVCAVYKSEKW
ncbi:MAG: pyruvoyl-dependent arginine decarboxylase [Candidatus Aenigmarchaeota archaeon]|nr:pyruvoyl-dependent arginine decarboxylase [Candidatus Aenigmarchaeota archaeon]